MKTENLNEKWNPRYLTETVPFDGEVAPINGQKQIYMTEEEAKDILRNKEQRLSAIRDKINQVLYDVHHLYDTDDNIRQAALPSSANAKEAVQGGGENKDMFNFLDGYKKMLKRQEKQLFALLEELQREEGAVHRLWQCFCAMHDPYYSILKCLYVDGELYQVAEEQSNYGHKKFESLRKDGLIQLVTVFNSNATNAWLKRQEKAKHQGKSEMEDCQQLSIEDFLWKVGG